MDTPPVGGNVYVFHGDVARIIRVNLAVVLEARQKVPAVPAHRLQIGKTGIPPVEANVARSELAFFGRLQHRNKVVVLRDLLRDLRVAFFSRLIEAAVAGKAAQAIGPQERREVDALHNRVVLAAPMACDQTHLLDMGLVECAVVYDQKPVCSSDKRLDFLP